MRLKINKLVKQNLLHKNTWIDLGFPIIQRVYSRLVASDLVNVQPNDFTNIWVNANRYTSITPASPLEDVLEEIRNLRTAQDHQARILEELRNQLQQPNQNEIRQVRINGDLIAQASRNARRLFNGTHDRY